MNSRSTQFFIVDLQEGCQPTFTAGSAIDKLLPVVLITFQKSEKLNFSVDCRNSPGGVPLHPGGRTPATGAVQGFESLREGTVQW